jgi:hypothetical protein
MPPTPNGYGGGLCIAVRLDGDVARAHGTGTGSDQWDRVTVSLCRRLAALRWGYCRSVARHLREQGGHHSSSQDMAWSGYTEICPGLGLWPVARGG